MMEDRYYVQRLTEQVFLIRERKSMEEEPGPDDRIVRSFVVRHDAYIYADTVNNKRLCVKVILSRSRNDLTRNPFSLVQCSLQATSKPLCTQPLIGRAALEYIILVQVNAASL